MIAVPAFMEWRDVLNQVKEKYSHLGEPNSWNVANAVWGDNDIVFKVQGGEHPNVFPWNDLGENVHVLRSTRFLVARWQNVSANILNNDKVRSKLKQLQEEATRTTKLKL